MDLVSDCNFLLPKERKDRLKRADRKNKNISGRCLSNFAEWLHVRIGIRSKVDLKRLSLKEKSHGPFFHIKHCNSLRIDPVARRGSRQF